MQKGLNIEGIEELLSFWNNKVIVNLSKFYINKNILESIDEIDKRIQKIDEKYQKKDEKDDKEEKRKKMIAMHNEGKTKTTYRKPTAGITNSQFLFNTPFVSESFQKVIKETKEEEEQNENIIDSLDNASFIHKDEELDKNIISIVRYKKNIIGYMDLDLLLQRIAMETPIYEEEMNDYLIEGICLQHTNFIVSNIFMTKIISCFNFNYSRYLKDQKETENEEKEDIRTRTDNFSIAIDHNKIKRSKRIFIGPKDESESEIMINKIELFKDTEKRIPYGLIHLILTYINTYKKYSLSDIGLDVASKIIELLRTGLDIYEIKNIYENEITREMDFLKNMIKSTIDPPKPKEKIPIDKIYTIKEGESFFDIFSFSSKDIATELTRVSYILFTKIITQEFFKGLFTKKDKEKTSPNICRAVERFNSISYWVIEEVLSYDYSSDRAKVIDKFIHIANELTILNNFNDCMSIISALGQMIINRLNKSWKKVTSKNMSLFRKIKKLLNFQNNYKNIRDEITKCLKEGKPFLPFLGYYTKRICFLEEAGPYVNKSGLINVDKISQVEQILSEFYDKNKVQYTFEIKDDIKNKLSILQCLEPKTEEELEKEGNLVEPNFVLCKKTKNKRITNTEIKFKDNYNKKNIL